MDTMGFFYEEGMKNFCLAREAKLGSEFWPRLKAGLGFIREGARQGCPLCSHLMPAVEQYQAEKGSIGIVTGHINM